MLDSRLEAQYAARAAERGINFLDKVYGHKDWVNRIDANKLDIASDCNCIIGQLSGSYNRNVHILDSSSATVFCFFESTQVSFPALTTAWRKQIRARQRQPHQELALAV